MYTGYKSSDHGPPPDSPFLAVLFGLTPPGTVAGSLLPARSAVLRLKDCFGQVPFEGSPK